jgi:hypothetical protein
MPHSSSSSSSLSSTMPSTMPSSPMLAVAGVSSFHASGLERKCPHARMYAWTDARMHTRTHERIGTCACARVVVTPLADVKFNAIVKIARECSRFLAQHGSSCFLRTTFFFLLLFSNRFLQVKICKSELF